MCLAPHVCLRVCWLGRTLLGLMSSPSRVLCFFGVMLSTLYIRVLQIHDSQLLVVSPRFSVERDTLHA